jgi:Rieske Fe-S protein
VADTQQAHAGAELTRGEFLSKATASTIGLGGILGLAIGVPVAGMALAPALSHRPKGLEALAGKVDDFEKGTYTKVVLKFDPDTPDAYIHERVAYVRYNGKGFTDKFTGNKDEFTVVSNRCAHLGCPVQESGGSFVCPCHGGAYDSEGRRTAGPPVRPLDRFSYEVRGDELWITNEYSLKNDGTPAHRPGSDKKQLRGPGQHTDGLEGWFYPLQP